MAKFEIFKEGNKERVPLRADRAGKPIDYDPTITIDVPDVPPNTPGYRASGKPLDPRNLPSDPRITWFTNFQVEGPRNPADNKRVKEKYSVTVRVPPKTADGEDRTLCYYDTESRQVVDIPGPYTGDTVTFKLDLVDPPSGFYP